jgi:hypothetical protein
MTKRRKKSKRRGLFNKRLTPDEQAAQRDAAFAAIRRLYGEALPLWPPAGAAFAGGTRPARAMSGHASRAAGRTCRRKCRSKRITPSCAAARGGFRRQRTRNGNCAVSRRQISSVEIVPCASTTHRLGFAEPVIGAATSGRTHWFAMRTWDLT